MIWRFLRRNYNTILTTAFVVASAMAMIDFIAAYVISVRHDNPSMQRALNVTTPAFMLSVLAIYLLIFAKGLRDEYVEKLWLKAARNFTILVLSAPWLWVFFLAIRTRITGQFDLGSDSIVPDYMRLPGGAAGVGQYQFEAMLYICGLVWTYCPLVFVALYKWHGWRDRD